MPSPITKIPTFILNLQSMLTRNDLQPIVRWDNTGNNIHITSISKFQQIVLPLFFRHSKFSSFVRQLNIYGFKKCKSDSLKGALFHHPHFSIKHINYQSFERKKLINRSEKKSLVQQEQSETISDFQTSLTLTNMMEATCEQKQIKQENEPTISELLQEIENRRMQIEIDDFMANDLQRIINEPKYERARSYFVGIWNSENQSKIDYERAEQGNRMQFIL